MWMGGNRVRHGSLGWGEGVCLGGGRGEEGKKSVGVEERDWLETGKEDGLTGPSGKLQ